MASMIIASIEMIEAVGHKNVPTYFEKVSNLLKDGGLFAMQHYIQ